jgi:hypothetical protein
VRHAYFCGADEPYKKLKKALRAQIDEAEWSKLYSTRSLPFEAPKNGKIAVKVINHYGDEVLKVFRAQPRGQVPYGERIETAHSTRRNWRFCRSGSRIFGLGGCRIERSLGHKTGE